MAVCAGTFDAAVAAAHGVDPASFVQNSHSRSNLGALRGLHTPAGQGEAKLVRCARGASTTSLSMPGLGRRRSAVRSPFGSTTSSSGM
jgi:dTDP-4-dehydrorhamnose 3,5-epimerase-like enzyme